MKSFEIFMDTPPKILQNDNFDGNFTISARWRVNAAWDEIMSISSSFAKMMMMMMKEVPLAWQKSKDCKDT